MSYNRGEFLLNCVESIERNFNFPYQLQIYDDNSDDEQTQDVLKSLSIRYPVYYNEEKKKKHLKVKGLYQNMNKALHYCYKNNVDFVMFLQDDMQVIRNVEETEFSGLSNLPEHFILVPLFFKMNHQKDYQRLLHINKEFGIYEPASPQQKYMNGIADIGLFNVAGLRKNNWIFLNDEGLNMSAGRDLGYQRVVPFSPFVSFLPWPKTNRSMYKGFMGLLKLVTDKIYNAGFHPYRDLDQAEALKLSQRDPVEIPFAENYLRLQSNVKLKQPWNYYDSFFPVRKSINDFKRLLK